MKIRQGFVSNSSSSSFVIYAKDDKLSRIFLLEKLRNAGTIALFQHVADPENNPVELQHFSDSDPDVVTDIATKYGYVPRDGSIGWYISIGDDNDIRCETCMDNFNLFEFATKECYMYFDRIVDERGHDL